MSAGIFMLALFLRVTKRATEKPPRISRRLFFPHKLRALLCRLTQCFLDATVENFRVLS